MQQRRGTAAQWTTAATVLLAGEIGFETDTGKFKIGDGTTAWASLAYQNISGAQGTTGAQGATGIQGAVGTPGAMNYVQTKASRQAGVSSNGSTIVSLSITTNGYPVKVDATGDWENTQAGAWVVLAIYRDGTKVGQNIHAEGSAGSENNPYALTVIDTPSAGTYTYAVKIVNAATAGGTFNWGETEGPVLTAIELQGATGAQGIQGTTGTANAFSTIAAPSGTNPVADSSTDTLTLTAGTGITITGDATADSIAIATNAASANGASTIVTRDASGNFAANAITATTLNGLSLTSSATGFTVAGGTTSKTLTVSNTITLAGTDSTVMTFPSASATIARTDTGQTFTGSQTFTPASNTAVSLIAKGVSFQSADLQQWQDVNSTVVASMGSYGDLTANTISVTSISGSGAGITSLNASNISSGTVPVGNLPTGTTGTTVALGDHTHPYLPLSGGALTGAVTFADVTSIEGRLIASSGVFYVQAGLNASDTAAVLTIARNGTSSTAISAFNIYATTSAFTGNITTNGTINQQYTDWTYLVANFR